MGQVRGEGGRSLHMFSIAGVWRPRVPDLKVVAATNVVERVAAGGARAPVGHRLEAILDPEGARCREDRPRPLLTARRSALPRPSTREGNKALSTACSVLLE